MKEVKKTFLKCTLNFVNPETLVTEFSLSLGIIERPQHGEKIRVLLAENNLEYLVLTSYEEILNPNYSPLTDFKK
nr:MAG TPA: hypothetical protein [Microviridae sp.]